MVAILWIRERNALCSCVVLPWHPVDSISSRDQQNDASALRTHQELVILPGACVWSLDTYFNLSPIYHFYVLFIEISHQASFCLQISYPAILFTVLMGFLNHGSFIVHVLLPGTSKAFTLSVIMPGARVHVLLPGTQRYNTARVDTLCWGNPN